jgi:hypothetical protein
MNKNSMLESEDYWDNLESLNNRFEQNKKILDMMNTDSPEYKEIHRLTDKVVEEIEALIGLKNQN